MTPQLTPASFALFLELANAAGDWAGSPLFEREDAASKGNLTDLKVKGLVTTCRGDRCVFVDFTEEGRALAAQHGVEIAAATNLWRMTTDNDDESAQS